MKRTHLTHNSEVSDAYTSRAVTAPKAKPDLHNHDSKEFERASGSHSSSWSLEISLSGCLDQICVGLQEEANTALLRSARALQKSSRTWNWPALTHLALLFHHKNVFKN